MPSTWKKKSNLFFSLVILVQKEKFYSKIRFIGFKYVIVVLKEVSCYKKDKKMKLRKIIFHRFVNLKTIAYIARITAIYAKIKKSSFVQDVPVSYVARKRL